MSNRVFTQSFVVAGAIIEKDGKILLVREGKEDPDKNKWNQPAGWVEVNENPIDTVRKEVKEESGYDFTPTHIIGIYSLVRKDIEKQVGATKHPIKFIFTGELGEQSSAPLADEIAEIRWFTKEEIDAMDVTTLRDIDIKREVADYFAGKRFPLALVTHTVQTL